MSSEVLLSSPLSDKNTNISSLPKISQKGEPPFGDFISKMTNREQNSPKPKDNNPELNNTTNTKSLEGDSRINSLNSKKENNAREEVKQDLQEANSFVKSEEKSSEQSVESSGDDANFVEEASSSVEEENLIIEQAVLLQLADNVKEDQRDVSDLESANLDVVVINPESYLDIRNQEVLKNKDDRPVPVVEVGNDDDSLANNHKGSDQEIAVKNTFLQSLQQAPNLIKEGKIEINLSDEKKVDLSQEEQTILLQMEKALSGPKLVNLQPDSAKQDNNIQVIDLNSQKFALALGSDIISKESPLVSGLNAIMADESKQGAEILENIMRNNLISSEETTKSTSINLEQVQLENMPKVVVKLDENSKHENKIVREDVKVEDQQTAHLMQDESAMSFENELGGFTNFVKTDVVSQKMDVSFDEFVAVNKNASIMKPEQQMAISLKHAISQGKSEVSISLYPKSLGHVDIKIEFASTPSGQNEVQKVVITSDRASTLRLFENTKAQLETALAELKKEAATTVTETNKKEASLEFEMRNGNGGEKNESYFGSSQERENWMNKFQDLTELDQNGEIISEANINEQSVTRPHYITSTSVNIEV